MTELGGIPLLSGPPPELEHDARAELSCRKCNKEFSVLFSRGRRCNHCGYTYCHSCSDYQALMPRSTQGSGYDPKPVCAFCIQYLTITAGGKGYLRAQSLAKLKNYMQAYNIRLGADVLEKDDVINAIINARNSNGCLPRMNESYYRKHAVPNGQTSPPRGLFSRSDRAHTAPRQNVDSRVPWAQTNFARPDLRSDQPQSSHPQQQQYQQPRQQARRDTQYTQYTPPPGPPPYAPYTSRQHSASSAPSGYYSSVNQSQPQRGTSVPRESQQTNSSGTARRHTASLPNRSANAESTAQPSQPSPPPVPTLDALLAMHKEDIAALSVGSLKAVLDRNHVPARLILEKSELVARVTALVTTERRERTRMAAVREHEAWEAQEREWAAREQERATMERERQAMEREVREQEERERRRRREAYRTTVESASESDGDDDGDREQAPEPGPGPEQSRSASAPPSRPPETWESTPQPARADSPDPLRQPRPERSGLCVVCQDEDANIVIVDCGHLALCRACADLIWSSTRECPLCRTRIITESRLLRVFKA